MSNNRVQLDGLEDFRAALRNLPADLTQQADTVVLDTANQAKVAMYLAYPSRTGNLRTHLKVTKESAGPYGVSVVVKNTAKHAALFEYGTQARHTQLGANRGSMPPNPVVGRTASQYRRKMFIALKDLLVRNGLLVTGDA